MDSNFKEVIVDRINRIVKIKGLRPGAPHLATGKIIP